MAAGDINDPLSQIPGIALADSATDPTDLGSGYALLKFKSGQLIWLPHSGSATYALDNLTPGQLHAITEKATPVAADVLLIEDSAASWAKKRVPWSALPGAGSGGWAEGAAAYGTTLTVSDETDTPIPLDNEVWDTNGLHSSVTNNTRITAQTTGKYVVQAHLDWASGGASGSRHCKLRKNGATMLGFNLDGCSLQGVCIVTDLAATDYVELIAWASQLGGVSSRGEAYAGNWLAVQRIG